MLRDEHCMNRMVIRLLAKATFLKKFLRIYDMPNLDESGLMLSFMHLVVSGRVLFAFLMLFLSGSLWSLPVGSPAFPTLIEEGFFIPPQSGFSIRIGYEGDFVGDERMNQEREGSGRVDSYVQNTNSGVVTCNVVDRLDLYGVFGSSRMHADWRFTSDDTVTRAEIQSRYRFLWGVGARAILYEWGCAILGLGGRYSSTHPTPSWLTLNGSPVSVEGGYVRWKAWQIDFDLAYRIDLFTPYIGIKFLDAQTDLNNFPVAIANNEAHTLLMQTRAPVGIVVGCTLSNRNYFLFNVEGRLIDEEAVTISGDIRF